MASATAQDASWPRTAGRMAAASLRHPVRQALGLVRPLPRVNCQPPVRPGRPPEAAGRARLVRLYRAAQFPSASLSTVGTPFRPRVTAAQIRRQVDGLRWVRAGAW